MLDFVKVAIGLFVCVSVSVIIVMATDSSAATPPAPSWIETIPEPPQTTTTVVIDLGWMNTTTTTTTAPPEVLRDTGTPSFGDPSTDAFFACIRHRESRGNYQAVNSTGTFRGAYQFYQGGWDTFAGRINRPDLIGLPPDQASPPDQDAIALAAYLELGKQPWNGAC
jgi:hypothetical protein